MKECPECGHPKDFVIAKDGHRYCRACSQRQSRCSKHESGDYSGQLTLERFGMVA
jgi:uncharacterized Zn finger protein (UPF0148 family)